MGKEYSKDQIYVTSSFDIEEKNNYIAKVETVFNQGLEKGDFTDFCSLYEEMDLPPFPILKRPIFEKLKREYYLWSPSWFGCCIINNSTTCSCYPDKRGLLFFTPIYPHLDGDVIENNEIFQGHKYFPIDYFEGAKAFTSYEKLKDYVGTLPIICPDEGEIIGYKVVDLIEEYSNSLFLCLKRKAICKLRIPADAQRISAYGSRKCRCNKAEVLAIYDKENEYVVGVSPYRNSNSVIYEVGEWVYADEFDPSPWVECSNGIHFFLTEEEAIKQIN